MQKLTCEVCNGGLIKKDDNFFECEYCGTKYSLHFSATDLKLMNSIMTMIFPPIAIKSTL